MSRTNRLFQLMQTLRCLPPPATAQVLAEKLHVTPRTIYRDIDALRGLGAIIDGAAGFGYRLIEDAALPPLNFDDDELEALVLGLREVGEVGDETLSQAATSALAKLRARLPTSQAHRLDHAVLSARRFTPLPAPGIDAAKLRKATWEEKTIRFNYTDAESRHTSREVDPLSVVFMQSSLCLLAWCHLREDFRAFRLDRMRELDLTGASFRPRRAAMLRECLDRMCEERAVTDASAADRA
ncbi:MAG: YafY family protein [Pseudomonadota bacterium]